MNDWKKYFNHPINESSCFYQKRFWSEEKGDIYAEIMEYKFDYPAYKGTRWEVEIQISDDLSPVGETINIKIFTYTKLDFEKIEKDIKKVLSLLISKPL